MRCIKSSFSGGDKFSLMKMGLGLASSPRLIWVTLSSVSDSPCSKRISQRVFRCLIQRICIWLNYFFVSIFRMFCWNHLTERSLKMSPALTSDSHDDVPDELLWYKDSSDSEADRIELTHSPTPSEFGDNSQGLSLLEQKIEAIFAFLYQSSSQDHLLGHTPCSSSFWVHLARNERTEGVRSRFPSLHESSVWTRLFRKRSVFDLCVLLRPRRRFLVHHRRFDMLWEMISPVHAISQGIYCRLGVIIYIGTSIWWYKINSKHRK